MELWRAKAIEFFPDLRNRIATEESPLELWCELYLVLVRIYEDGPMDEERIRQVYAFAKWSVVHTNDDVSNAVAVGFIESIPLNKRLSEDLHRWMSAETFDGCEKLFRYHLEDKQFQVFSAAFHRKKRERGNSSSDL